MSLELLFVAPETFPGTMLKFGADARVFPSPPDGKACALAPVVPDVKTPSVILQTSASHRLSLLPSPAAAQLSLAEPGEWQTFPKWMMTLFFSKLTATCCPSPVCSPTACVDFSPPPPPPSIPRQGGHRYCNLSRHLSLILSDSEGLPRGLMSVELPADSAASAQEVIPSSLRDKWCAIL